MSYGLIFNVFSSEHGKPPGQCRLWRMSFSAAEKTLLYGAGGKKPSGETLCRKDVLRLLKLDLAAFYEKRDGEPQEFSSYNLKMLMLNLYDLLPDSKDWEKDKSMLDRYIDALRVWKTSIADRQLSHYFIKEENMLHSGGIAKDTSQLDALGKWVSDCLKKYEAPKIGLAWRHSNNC